MARTRDVGLDALAWDRAHMEDIHPYRHYRTVEGTPFLNVDNTADLQAAVNQAYARQTTENEALLRFRNNPSMGYTDSSTTRVAFRPTAGSMMGSMSSVIPLDPATLNDMQSRLTCIESVLTRTPGYESAMSIAANAGDYSQELQSLLREFNTKAAEKGLLDITDPENRALADLCRHILRRADASARRTQYAKEAEAHKVTSPELDGARIGYLNTRLEALNTNIASVDTKIQTEKTKVAELERYINQLKNAFERHSEHQKRVMEAFTAAYVLPSERLQKLEEFYNTYEPFVMRLQGQLIPTLEARLDSIEARLASVEAKLNSSSGNRPNWTWTDHMPKWTCRT